MHRSQDAERFVVESKVTAQLPHPGVPPVYALGELADGRPFLAMKLIQGRTLADELKAATRDGLPRLLGAIAAFRDGIRSDPTNARAHNGLAIALSESGDIEGAIAAFREAVRVNTNPKFTDPQENLEMALKHKAQLEERTAPPRAKK